MQTDTWLTDATHPDCCPLCSHPQAAGSNICPSCGFTAHEPVRNPSAPGHTRASGQSGPITPIPARASALRSQGAAGRFVSPQPAPFSSPSPQQARGLRHDSPSYEAVSSLSSLSLIIAETPTAPPRMPARQRQTGVPIDEIDTVPQRSDPPTPGQTPQPLTVDCADLAAAGRALVPTSPQRPAPLPGIDEIDTVPEGASRALQVPASEQRVVRVTAASWTAGPQAALTHSAGHTSRVRRFSLLDRTRWWLLRPGHIEFLLWLAGSVLLFGITFLFLLALALSVLVPAPQRWGNFPSEQTPASSAATPARPADLHLQLAGSTTHASGSELHLQGQGFRPASQISFWLDGRWPLLDQHGGPARTQADASGRFAVNLWLGQGAPWSAGQHQLLAREMDNGQQAAISISLTAPTVTPVAQDTPLPPVHPTPVPSTPTPIRPTPTAQPTPWPSATAGITPTASPAATNVPGTSVASPGAVNSSSLGNDVHTGDGSSLFTRLLHLNPLVWVICMCYLLSMLFLGLAGVLRRRRR